MVPPLRGTPASAAAALGAAALLLLSACGGEPAERVGVPGAAAEPSGRPGAEAPPAATPHVEAPHVEALPVEALPVVEVGVTVARGEVRGVPGRVEVPLGGTVRLTVTADTPDEVHVHGYDRTLPLTPGTPAVLELPADIPGVFEVELHDSGLALTSLQVQ